MPSTTPQVPFRSTGLAACRLALTLFVMSLCCPSPSYSELTPFAASPDQVLVIYNADWTTKSAGSTVQDSRAVAEYYVTMHTDPKTGKKPYLLGLTCKHLMKNHLNDWFIKEDSYDNTNGIVFKGKGSPPSKLDWLRDSRKVEIHVTEPDADWNTLLVRVRSEQSGEERIVTPLSMALRVSGIPSSIGDDASYPPPAEGKGRSIRLDASRLFRGTVTVSLTLKNRSGKQMRDLPLRYWDARDFAFSPTGPDGIPDDRNLEDDVLGPVRRFLEAPANALPDGTLLKNHILYVVVVHGLPYAASGLFGIAHGATANPSDHGALASLEQRLQTIYYAWDAFKPTPIPFHLNGGPDADKGVVNHVIATAYRHQLGGARFNPYMHPDTYGSLNRPPRGYSNLDLPPFPQQRSTVDRRLFAYGVTRVVGATAEEAKRLVDYAVYATRHLRPEIDCRVRAALAAKSEKEITDPASRLERTVRENLWGDRELSALGFVPLSTSYDQGVPFLARPVGEGAGSCGETAEWKTDGFYPGGMGRKIESSNGLNFKNAEVWRYLEKGVTVTAAGAPAYSGGPHITNATFWDNAILTRCLFHGRDLGECFLRATWYVNWSTSLIGDPLCHPDLHRTSIDRTPPRITGELAVSSSSDRTGAIIEARAEVAFSADAPEVALLRIVAQDPAGKETVVLSPLYSRNPLVTLKGLAPDMEYSLSPELVDPYGNRTKLPSLPHRTPAVNVPLSIFKDFIKGIKVGK